jgi:hypothetical protein
VASISRYDRTADVDPATGLRAAPAADGVVTHTVSEGDRLDHLALRYYRESRAWWRLCDANPDLPWPLDVVGRGPHRTVRIPLGAADRWPDAFPKLMAVPGVVRATLAEPPAVAPSRQHTAVAVVVHDRLTLSAEDIRALLGDLELEPGGYDVVPTTGRAIAVPTNVVG